MGLRRKFALATVFVMACSMAKAAEDPAGADPKPAQKVEADERPASRPAEASNGGQSAQSASASGPSASSSNANAGDPPASTGLPLPPSSSSSSKNSGLPPQSWENKPSLDQPVNWQGLAKQTSFFLGISHGFRLATEQGTRDGLKGPFFDNWAQAVASMHGWSDGDEFLVNYIGHPMQGSVTGYIWANNDPKYFGVQFGMNSAYWRSRFRATLYSFLYSEQFEIGPLSEASLGAIQRKYPAYGFVDHVITPMIGLGWMTMEDALDRWVIKGIEQRWQNKYLRLLVRGGLNPSRSMANAMAFKVPWHRNDRPGVGFVSNSFVKPAPAPKPPEQGDKPWDKIPAWDLNSGLRVSYMTAPGARNVTCVGSGVTAVRNVTSSFGLLFDTSFCYPENFPQHRTGDMLTYSTGARWTFRTGRVTPRVEFLVGGQKITQDLKDPQKRDEIAKQRPGGKPVNEDWEKFTQSWSDHNLALGVGAGVDMVVNRVVSLQLADFRYTRTWLKPMNGFGYQNQYQWGIGANLRVGTW